MLIALLLANALLESDPRRAETMAAAICAFYAVFTVVQRVTAIPAVPTPAPAHSV